MTSFSFSSRANEHDPGRQPSGVNQQSELVTRSSRCVARHDNHDVLILSDEVASGDLRAQKTKQRAGTMPTNVVIASIARTPIGRFRGSLSSLKAPELGSIAIRGALSRLGENSDLTVRDAIVGNVVSAGLGQAPARQAVVGAGLPLDVCCTTVNKVCASGMKSVMLAAQSLQCSGSPSPGYAIIAGGMESMSNVPHYVMGSRNGFPLGNATLLDGVIHDGLVRGVESLSPGILNTSLRDNAHRLPLRSMRL